MAGRKIAAFGDWCATNSAIIISGISFALSAFTLSTSFYTWNDFSYNIPVVQYHTLADLAQKKADGILEAPIIFYNDGNRPVEINSVEFYVVTDLPADREYFHDRDCDPKLHPSNTTVYLMEDKNTTITHPGGNDTNGIYGFRQIPAQSVPAFDIAELHYRHSLFSQLNNAVSSIDGLLCAEVVVTSIGGRAVTDDRPLQLIKATIGTPPVNEPTEGIEDSEHVRRLL